jgi:hypothetical protein
MKSYGRFEYRLQAEFFVFSRFYLKAVLETPAADTSFHLSIYAKRLLYNN